MSIDNEWLQFKDTQNSNLNNFSKNIEKNEKKILKKQPKCSEIYISTQTKIAYLNQNIDLNYLFWNIPVIDYFSPKNGIIKKSIKINCNSEKEHDALLKKISDQKNIFVTELSSIKNKKKFKKVKKIDIGLCEKDIISYRKKQKGAFYNCFALILRIQYKDRFREVHVKIFNTGKLEIPGIQYDDLLTITLDILVDILQPFIKKKVSYNKDDINTVLINSNFSCGYFLDRFKLFQQLKYKYNIQASYDPCSYPGIQCLFYYNHRNKEHNGVHLEDEHLQDWKKISFMIFRTGSVLIVGNCNKEILHIVYNFIKSVLNKEYHNIFININDTKKKQPKKKLRKKMIKLDI
tara:strand:- start:583 stop:1626 length:1044 start_codon:yes stop_codon:yes gene_type:complete